MTLATQLGREPSHPAESIGRDRDDSLADNMTLRCQSVYAEEKIVRRARLTRRFKTTTFSTDNLRACYQEIHGNFGLPGSHATKVVDEIETHTGLFFQSAQDRFEFSHKSLQEFLAAEFIVRMPSIPTT